jgi:hypothetical protein
VSTAPARWWIDTKALAWPVATYWLSTMAAFTLFFGLIIYGEGVDEETPLVIGIFGSSTAVGIAVGQIVGIARIRTWLAVTVLGPLCFAGFFLGMYLEGSGLKDVGMFIGLFFFFAGMFMTAGLWSVRIHMGPLAAWAPLVYLVGCTIYIAEEITNSDQYWHSGEKWRTFDVVSAPVLLAGVMMLLVFLVSRETHRLHLWRFAPKGPDLPRTVRRRDDLRGLAGLRTMLGGRAGCGGLLALILLGVALTAATAVVAPYLWRTGPRDGDGDGEIPPGVEDTDGDGVPDEAEDVDGDGDPNNDDTDGDGIPDYMDPDDDGDGVPTATEDPNGDGDRSNDDSDGDGTPDYLDGDQPPPPDQGCNQSSPPPEDPPEGMPEAEQMKRVVKNAGISLMALIMMLLLAIASFFVFGPPVRRTALLTHLRRPLWPVPPTRRILHHWALVEVALGDIGVRRRPGDTASTLAARAVAALPSDWDTAPLLEVAEIADRVVYGLGVAPSDSDRARRSARMTYEAVWELMREREKIKAVYRWV